MSKVVIILSIFLTGCGGYVSKEQIISASAKCDKNNGLDSIWIPAWFVGSIREIHCSNGAKFEESK